MVVVHATLFASDIRDESSLAPLFLCIHDIRLGLGYFVS